MDEGICIDVVDGPCRCLVPDVRHRPEHETKHDCKRRKKFYVHFLKNIPKEINRNESTNISYLHLF